MERLWIVDGTLIPARERKVGASSRNYRFSANVQDGHSCPAKKRTMHAEHRRVRVRVAHAFAHMKHYKILRDCRQHGDGLHHAVQAVAPMHNLVLTA